MGYSMMMKKQQGAVLAICLILLTVMTILGVTSISNSTLEEKMSSNARDRAVALQNAEVGLLEAEKYLAGIVTVGDFGAGSNGLYENNTEAWKTIDWDGNAGYAVVDSSEKLSQAVSAPKYIIEMGVEIESVTEAENLSGGYGDDVGGEDVTVFLITVKASGASPNSSVLLQSYFGKEL